MSNACLIGRDDFGSCLITCTDPDLPCEACNNGFIKEINGQLNFENELFESTDAGENAIQV